MGAGAESHKSFHCPWSEALVSAEINRWFSTYWMVKELGVWPPGRLDPQLLSACAIIAGEHHRINKEEYDRAKEGS